MTPKLKVFSVNGKKPTEFFSILFRDYPNIFNLLQDRHTCELLEQILEDPLSIRSDLHGLINHCTDLSSISSLLEISEFLIWSYRAQNPTCHDE